MIFCVSAMMITITLSGEQLSHSQKIKQVADIVRSNPAISGAAISGINIVDGKCGLKLMMVLREYWNSFTPQQQNAIRQFLSVTFEETRTIGHFEINYDTSSSNPNTPGLLSPNGTRIPNTAEQYVDSVGKYFNYAWTIEVDSLGFLAPPFQAGHSAYVVNIVEEGGSYYGLTQFVDQIAAGPPALWTTYIEIDNDYAEFYSVGMAGLRVTSAHEFNHSIQMGRYGYWGPSAVYFHEITSTWLEDYVHDDVDDYYAYLESPGGSPRGQFLTPEISFVAADGLIEYSRAVWGKYIQKRFSPKTMREIWEFIHTSQILPSINQALVNHGSSLQQGFLEWTVWNYHTGRRADSVLYYNEGKNYPLIHERDTTIYHSPTGFFTDSLQSLASVYHPILLDSSRKFYTVISEINSQALNFFALQNVRYLMQDAVDTTYKWIDSLVYAKIDVSDPMNWKSQESLPTVEPPPVQPPVVTQTDVLVYPNPLVYPNSQSTCDDCLKFILPGTIISTEGRLTVYATDYHKICDNTLPITLNLNGKWEITWNAKNANGLKASSGLYIYSISVDAREYHGKLAIVKK
ncbi:MAG: MXAN_6640 family putative metalloprotease [Bacteroidota bacterium]